MDAPTSVNEVTEQNVELHDNWKQSAFLSLTVKEAIEFLQSTGSNALTIGEIIRNGWFDVDNVLEPYKQSLIKFLIERESRRNKLYRQ